MIKHYDLFAGIGGFSLALEEVFDEPIKHVFCEWESFPTSVLKKHWPDGQYWGDIAELVTHTKRKRLHGDKPESETERQRGLSSRARGDQEQGWAILTGGFPCQPFSAAGRRKGTADHRYQWPNMLEVIRNVKPRWVIAENVRGLVTWNEGLVLETICTDLEGEGYEVQPFIIPAVAVGAPHRRDRVWIIGHNSNAASERRKFSGHNRQRGQVLPDTDGLAKEDNPTRSGRDGGTTPLDEADTVDARGQTVADTRPSRRSEGSYESIRSPRQEPERKNHQYPDWQRNWQEVAFATCDDSVDDGLSRLVDGVSYSQAKWRRDSLKAYGNGIVSQVAIEIMKAIKGAKE